MFSKKTLYIFSTISFLWFLTFCVINNTKVKSDSVISRDYYFGDTEKVLVGYETYGNNIKLGKWNQSIVPVGYLRFEYNEHWAKVLRALGMPPGCNAVDIGANDGETAVMQVVVFNNELHVMSDA